MGLLDAYDHLNIQSIDNNNDADVKAWCNKSDDLFTDLLLVIGKILNYDFSVDHLKRKTYIPRAHGKVADELQLVRKGVLNLLCGKVPVKVQVVDKDKND